MKINDLFESEGLGLTIFDIDETLMRTTAKIKVVKDGKVIRSLTNQEFNNYKLQPGEQFDFGEFRNAEKFRRESEPIAPMIAKLKAILRNAGNSKVIMLTARADFDNKETFLNTFRDLGIDMSRVHVHRAGNLPGNPAENKAVWIRKYLDTGKYSRVRLYDDSMGNIRMFNALAKEYPNVKFFPYLVTHDGGVKTVREARSFAPQVTPLQSLVNEYLFFSSFGTMEAPGDAKSPDSEAKLNDVITRLAQSNKSLQNLDKQKLEANRDKILNHIHDMMKYAIAHLREHLPPEKFDEKKNQINSVLTKYNAAASTNESIPHISIKDIHWPVIKRKKNGEKYVDYIDGRNGEFLVLHDNGRYMELSPRNKAYLKKEFGLEENFSESKLNYSTPNFEQEWKEAERYPEFRKIGKNAWIELAGKGKSVTIRSAKDINNTDAADPNSFKMLDKTKQSRALDQLKSGTVEMPIIAVYPDGYKELVGGNTRLTAMMAQNGEAKVWIFSVPDEVAELAEQLKEDGRIVKGVNTTVDVGPNEIKRQAAKFGNTVDKNGFPPFLRTDGKNQEIKYTAREWAIISGGHVLEEETPKPKLFDFGKY